MSNYVKSTDFAAKDALASGNSGKIVKGTEIDIEFNNIATAIATKADTASPAFTGNPTAPTPSSGDNDTSIATTAFVQTAAAAAVAAAKEALFPVGSIYVNAANSTNPGTLLGFGTWVAFGAGRVMVGFDGSNALFDTAEETGGSADAIVVSHTHTATVTDPGHLHTVSVRQVANISVTPGSDFDGFLGGSLNTSTATTGVTVANSTTGSSGVNANYQPYITVYMWKRTA